eukprot:SAG11_NODE_1959_length_3999_cov_1.662308_4_plen_96_part_00
MVTQRASTSAAETPERPATRGNTWYDVHPRYDSLERVSARDLQPSPAALRRGMFPELPRDAPSTPGSAGRVPAQPGGSTAGVARLQVSLTPRSIE